MNGAVINKIQLILAEKRTSLAVLRTGIAVFALPLTVLSFLVATSKYYDFVRVIHFLVPIFIISAVLITLGFYLIIRAIKKIRRYDRSINAMKEKYSEIASLID